jgi:hypothetical protein
MNKEEKLSVLTKRKKERKNQIRRKMYRNHFLYRPTAPRMVRNVRELVDRDEKHVLRKRQRGEDPQATVVKL